jgi:hypothetical protein
MPWLKDAGKRMRHLLRFAAAAPLLLCLVDTACAPADQGERAKVEAIIARSKLTRATYAVYFWDRIPHPDQPVEEWSAEFNSGSLHRVETSRDRVIADCAVHKGMHLSLSDGNIVSGPQVAAEACGINTNREFLAEESLGRIKTHFGGADRVRVTDSENIRTYDISDEGIILHTVYETNDARHLKVLDIEAVEVSRSLPSPDMFDEASLKASFVPEAFKVAPKASR